MSPELPELVYCMAGLAKSREGGMKPGILVVVALTNIIALFGIVFFVVEAGALTLIGVPLFVHHLRKGLSPGQALSASLDTVMSFISGWV